MEHKETNLLSIAHFVVFRGEFLLGVCNRETITVNLTPNF